MTPEPPSVSPAERLVTEARARLGVRRAALFLRRGSDGGLACVATAGEAGSERWLGQALRAGVGVAGRTVAEGRPVWSPDLLADPRTPVAPWLRERLEAEDLRSVLAAPLQVGALTVGALGVLDGAGRVYPEDETRLLAGLASAAALAAWTELEGPAAP